MRARTILRALAIVGLLAVAANASAEESQIHVGAIDAVLRVPPDVERPPVALLIAGSGTTDRDGNGPQIKPATLKKLAEQLAARKIATLRYDKRGAGGWKPEFGRPEDFRFKDYVDDAAALVDYLRGKFSKVILVGHSEGGLVAILTARRVPVDRLVLLATAARRQGDLLKAQLEKKLPAETFTPIAKAIDDIMAGQIVDPPPQGLSIPPAMQPGIASAFTEDPIAPLKLVEAPTLIIAGGRDRQLARLDFIALTAAAPTAKTLWLDDMNHVLVDVVDDGDDLAAYNQPERALDPDLIEAVAAFILGGDTGKIQ
ncbi:MAG TPA: alpha/beta fold hydrolase [Bradyrhizobium sp.]|jgi:pimeloyl-ACP methyl ester carboxylesterase|uniref:alpha/beta hydrolase n=1 Tax=Bradyrhizobium sp. TaxID=376 RepID=UPI002C423305|nr:alpha/beta fold hydrolase [Bradyrhizobium sp.]HTB02728.1 alpha/beta fold hydrolase [Bradyrhizobium sp.]